MKKNVFKLTAIACGLALIFLQVNCSKNDSRITKLQNAALKSTDSMASPKPYSPDSSKKISLTDSAQRLSSSQSTQIRTGNTKEKLLTPTLIQQHSSGNTYPLSGSTAYACGASFTDYYYGTGFHMYPYYALDFSSTPRGSSISINVESYDVPNRFTLYDANGTYITGTSWMGYANYSGPWGSSLNTAGNQILTFTTGSTSSYSLRVETITQDYSDSWTAGIGCTAPVPQSIDYNQLAIEHNNALDYIHFSYSSGGPYSLQTLYNGIVSYCNTNSKPLPNISYQELIYLKNQVLDFGSFLDVMQSTYNAFTNNEKNELNTLYQNLNATTTDAEADIVLQNFNSHINLTTYTSYEKSRLLGVSAALYAIADFWSSTENFMAAPGETQTWQQRAAEPLGFNSIQFSDNTQILAWKEMIHSKGPNPGNSFEYLPYRKCRLRCVLCVAIMDTAALVGMTSLSGGNVVAGAIAAPLWSLIARCCGICGSCGNVNCSL